MKRLAFSSIILSSVLTACASDPQMASAQQQVTIAYNKDPACSYVFLGGVVTDVESSQSAAIASARLLAYKMGANYVSIQSVNPYPLGHVSVSGKAFHC